LEITMTAAFWASLALLALIHVLVLRGLVPIVAKGAENAWDNAFTYVLVSGLLLYFPVRWMLFGGGWLFPLLAFPLLWTGQTIALRTLYEMKTLRAWVLGILHTATSGIVTSAVVFTAGLIAAYILYGKIISDPMILLRIILKLIGIDLPFEST
jgi:hypothetical protein